MKESTAFILRAASKENRQLILKRPNLCNGFQKRVFKGNIRGEDHRVCDHFMDIFLIDWW